MTRLLLLGLLLLLALVSFGCGDEFGTVTYCNQTTQSVTFYVENDLNRGRPWKHVVPAGGELQVDWAMSEPNQVTVLSQGGQVLTTTVVNWGQVQRGNLRICVP